MPEGAVLDQWQRDLLDGCGIDPDAAQHFLDHEGLPAESSEPFKINGDPTLGGDGLRVAVDADCPHCGWPERYFDTTTRRFGCLYCRYTSDERNA